MTAVRLPFLLCDYAECDEEFGPGVDDDKPVDKLRTKAKESGWSHPLGLDLCPLHTANLGAGRGRMRVVGITRNGAA